MKRIHPFALVLVLVVTFFAGAIIATTIQLERTSLAMTDEPSLPATTAAAEVPRVQPAASTMFGNPYAIADVAERATPGVVLITVEWRAPERVPETYDPFSIFFDFFGGNPFGSPFPQQPRGPVISNGSGFLFDAEGHIFTNQHVVGDAGQGQRITVKLHPSSHIDLELEAEIVGSDYDLDLAILKLVDVPEEYKGKLPYLAMGDSDSSRPGEWVIAIGNPYGYEHTVTVGSLSAKGREITIFDRERRREKLYRDLLQTDAAINQGNSGGPLLNIEGEVIGINTAVNAAAQGIGFAIPINSALAVRDELIETGAVARTVPATESLSWQRERVSLTLGRAPGAPTTPFVGIRYWSQLPEDVAEDLDLPVTSGIFITEVVPNSPAQQAGLQPDDVIIAIDGVEVHDEDDIKALLSTMRPGRKVIVTFLRYQPERDDTSAA